MLKVHIYHGNGKSATIKASGMIGLTIMRQDSVQDPTGYVRPKGRQMVMLEIREDNGQLFITNHSTGLEIKV